MNHIRYERLFEHMRDLRAADLNDDGSVKFGYDSYGGRPIKMYFDGTTVQPNGNVDCSGSTISAIYLEWQRLEGEDFSKPDSDRLPKGFYEFWVPYATLDGEAGFRESSAGCVHTYLEASVGDGGTYNLVPDPNVLRRGDLAQIWWKGPGHNEGHSVFIHDTLVDAEGRVWFQLLSSQNPNHKDTDGIGVAGSGQKKYDLSAATQKTLFEKGKWYRYADGDTSARSTIIPEIYVARFARPFPCWPCPATGVLDEVAAVSHAAVFYAQAERSLGGGYYPIGLNRTWHGGVHLRPPKGSPVFAVADGVIVAARCPEVDVALDAARAGHVGQELPSRSFVLIRHQLEIGGAKKTFYSLYMHLAGDPSDEDCVRARWLWKTRQTPGNNLKLDEGARVRLDRGEVVKLAEPIGAGEVIGFTAGDYLHFEIVAEEDLSDGDYPERLVIEDADKDLFIDQKKLVDLLHEKMDLKTKVEARFWGGERVVADGMIAPYEVRAFFVLGAEEQRRPLRGLVCKHVSEWSTEIEWPKLEEVKCWGYLESSYAASLAETCKLYAWLDADIATHAKLPASHQLHHYHPIQLLTWLAGKRDDEKAKNVVQEVVPFLTGAGQQISAPAGSTWYVNDDARGKDGQPVKDLAIFGGSEEAPDPRKPLIGEEEPPKVLREEGPWPEQKIWDSPDGTQRFVRVSRAGDAVEWICAKWGDQVYAERRGAAQ